MYDPCTRQHYTENRFGLVENGQVVCRDASSIPRDEGCPLSQLAIMVQEAGYPGVRAVAGFSSEPATGDDEVFCILGIRFRLDKTEQMC